MKKSVFFIVFALVATTGFAQEDKAVTKRLKQKYGYVVYYRLSFGYYGYYKVNTISSSIEGMYGACDASGKEIIPCKYDGVYKIKGRNPYIKVWLNGKYGVYDLSGKEIIPCKYDDTDCIGDDFLTVKINNMWIKWSDKEQQVQNDMLYAQKEEQERGSPPPTQTISTANNITEKSVETTANFAQENKVVTERLKQKYAYVFYHRGAYEVNLVRIYNKGTAGVCDLNGKEIVPCKYDVTMVGGDFIKVKLNNKEGVYNFNGNEIIPCKYDVVWVTEYVSVELNGKKGVYDLNGKEIIPCKYDDINCIADGVFTVKLNEIWVKWDNEQQVHDDIFAIQNKKQERTQKEQPAKEIAQKEEQERIRQEQVAKVIAQQKEQERIRQERIQQEQIAQQKEQERIQQEEQERIRQEQAAREAEYRKTLSVPKVTITDPINGSIADSDKVKIFYNVSVTAPTSVKISIDGKPAQLITDARLGQNTVTVNIPDNDCRITVVAQNEFGASPPAMVNLIRNVQIFKPSLYILAIGVSAYENSEIRLQFPAKDASDFAQALMRQVGLLYESVDVKLLTDGKATAENIRDGLHWLQTETTNRDIAMLYMAGHGVNNNVGDFFFMPVNADVDRINATCVSYSDIKMTISAIAGKLLVFMDACHSGNVLGNLQQRSSVINQAINELTGADNGPVVFTSSTGRQFSLESPEWNNGAFSKALVEGINGKADLSGRKMITIKSLDYYIATRVKELTQGKQAPTTIIPRSIPDFPIAVISDR